MGEVSIIGVDLAKNVFQLHGATADGSVVFRKKLSRLQFGRFMASQVPCEVAMEACPSAHHWARELTTHGHHVRLIAPHYVKPFVKLWRGEHNLINHEVPIMQSKPIRKRRKSADQAALLRIMGTS